MTNSFPIRIIARLDLKEEYLIKGIYFEGLKKVGCPVEKSKKYYMEGIDEILCIDVMASLYKRKVDFNTLKNISKNSLIPLTGGGGISNIKDVEKCFYYGCDKITINTKLFNNKKLITQIVDKYGSQALQGSIQAKKINGKFYAFTKAARENSFKLVLDHALELQDLGVGEMLITSADRDGTLKGIDWHLLEKLRHKLEIPLIFCGGLSSLEEFKKILRYDFLSGIAIGSALHSNRLHIKKLKSLL